MNDPRPHLSLGIKARYGAGSVAYGAAFAGLSGAVLQIYFNQVLGLPALVVGTAIMVSLMIDAVIDPLIGRWSDRARSRWGRRHPFMFASAIPVTLFFFLLWNAPAGLATGALVMFSFLMMAGTRVSISFYEIPSNALTPELTPDYDQRTTLQSWRWFFGIIGSAAASVLLAEVFLAGPHKGVLYRQGYAHWGALIAAVLFVSIMVSTLGTRSRIPYLPQAVVNPARGARDAWREIRLTFANASLGSLMLSGILGGVGSGITQSLSIYLYSYYWGLEPREFGLLIPLGSIGSLLAVFLAPPLSRRFGKKAAMIGLFSFSVVTAAGPLFLRLIGFMPPNGSPWILPILAIDGIVTTTVAIVGYILVGSMMADVVEDAAAKSGVRSEGLLYAANGLVPKFTGGIGAFIAGLLLTVVHFPAHARIGSVDPSILRHLVMIYLPTSVILSVVAISALGLYRIDRRMHERNLRTLEEAAAAAAQAHVMEGIEIGDSSAPVARPF
ncbi:MAG TPA: MFS transporter [Caulobacteraceae bacterium]|jgi:Na+/melibiose symporter-like transporter